jgi:hypothetical protein
MPDASKLKDFIIPINNSILPSKTHKVSSHS